MFPSAAPPEIMRAAEKDDQYMSLICDACYDAFRHAFGTRLAVAYQNETRLAGRALYYLLTTGTGLQTLGEEYCDIMQVTSSGLPPSPARRVLLVFYQAILPYLGERASSRAAARGMFLANQDDSQASSSSTQRQDASLDSGLYKSLIRKSYQLRALLRSLWIAALRRWAVLLPLVKEGLQIFVRANLMLFYFEGMYYHLAKRFARIKYIYMGKPAQQRPRYQILGMFLLIQVAILSGQWLRRSIVPAVTLSMNSQSVVSGRGSEGLTVLDGDGKPTKKSLTDLGSIASSGKCPLCLSPRQHPTATTCGHVFCWTCVAEWCNEKPECPLCRALISHSDLVCVYHADF